MVFTFSKFYYFRLFQIYFYELNLRIGLIKTIAVRIYVIIGYHEFIMFYFLSTILLFNYSLLSNNNDFEFYILIQNATEIVIN